MARSSAQLLERAPCSAHHCKPRAVIMILGRSRMPHNSDVEAGGFLSATSYIAALLASPKAAIVSGIKAC